MLFLCIYNYWVVRVPEHNSGEVQVSPSRSGLSHAFPMQTNALAPFLLMQMQVMQRQHNSSEGSPSFCLSQYWSSELESCIPCTVTCVIHRLVCLNIRQVVYLAIHVLESDVIWSPMSLKMFSFLMSHWRYCRLSSLLKPAWENALVLEIARGTRDAHWLIFC